ncbi:MAG TPA: HAMP domain-containing sensor histidine kinase [Roseiflexaceae bacterium]|nr:HAMP domain-containing sensor histidine kinase [Roseiflexaceae bacterium]
MSSQMKTAPAAPHPAASALASVQQVESLARNRSEVLLHGAQLSRSELARAASELAQLAGYLTDVSVSRSQFMGKVAHELRTPLTIAKGWASLLHDHPIHPEQHRIISVIEQQIDDLTRLVNDLLDLSRRETDSLSLHLERINLVALAHHIAEHQRELTTMQGISVQVRCAVEEAYAVVDRGRIAQVLNNLIGNACRYVPHFSDGRIELGVGQTDTAVQLSVHDNGIGIAPEHLPQIFEPFYQIGGRRRGKSGLGLTIAKELVEAHGGVLRVESEPGRGTTFHIWLRRVGRCGPEAGGDDA